MSYALITGASSGIGYEFSRLFAKQQIPLILSASPRSEKELKCIAEELKKEYRIEVHTIAVDLAEAQGAKHLLEWLEDEKYQIDYLVNNAGFGIVGKKIHEYDPERMTEMLQVNVIALTQLLRYIVPDMIQRGFGRILNVSSIAGYVVPHGLEAGYSASKAYVVSFSEGVNDDLRGTGVTCTHLAPGPVKTRFFATAGLKNESRIEKMYMSADRVAKLGFDGMMEGRRVVIPGLSNKLLKWLVWMSPSKRLVAFISAMVIREPS